MLALNGIFILVTQHGLEYPVFYMRLYQLITADAFAAKHRAQFFKLADLFLSSGTRRMSKCTFVRAELANL